MSIQQKTIPISPVKTLSESFAIETASRAVENFLSAYYPAEFIARQRSGAAIVGQWISLMPGREKNQASDLADFAQDLVIQIQIGDQRSLISDALSFFLGGLMPTYTRAKVLAGMLADMRPAVEVEAYFHSIGYGSVKKFVEQIGPSMKGKAVDKYKALIEVVTTEVKHLEVEWRKETTILLAQANPAYAPTQVDVPRGGVAANDPKIPRPQPNLRLVPPPPPPQAGGASRLLPRLATLVLASPVILVGAVLMVIPGNVGQGNPEAEFLRKQQEERAKQNTAAIPYRQTEVETAANQNTNECQQQIEANQKNGAQCENDGYVLMEKNLQYKRLVDPPKGRGLDGLFEKLEPGNLPNPMPKTVELPKPGKLIFIPEDATPPQSRFDYTGKPPQSRYPKFVVWEAKHISRTFDPSDTEGMKKAGKNALGVTCDGAQMGTKWTENRIPQALNREHPKNRKKQDEIAYEIEKHQYARWIFLCLPGPVGDSKIAKIYALIDITQAGIDLESIPAKPRKQSTSKSDTGY